MTTRLDRFELVEELGRGGCATVHRARYRWTPGSEPWSVAVKVVDPTRLDPERGVTLLEDEARAAARLDHPSIVRLWDVGRTGPAAPGVPANAPFLAMELCEGGTLRAPRGSHAMGWPRLRSLLTQVLEALAHAHARGVVHLDVKPSNVLLDAQGRAKLGDFGIARSFAVPYEAERASRPVWGTTSYMAPEQLRGASEDLGPWTDLYALGCVAWALSCGQPPFAGRPEEVAAQKLEGTLPPFAPRYEVPAGLERWVRGLLDVRIGSRFGHSADARAELARLDETDAARVAEDEIPTAEVDLTLADGPDTEKIPSLAARRPTVGPLPTPRPAPEHPPGLGPGLWGLRSWPLHGRATHRARLWELLGEVAERGTPRIALLVGSAGRGKSRLAEWLAEEAHERGLVEVLSAVHAPDSRVVHGLGGMLARHLGAVGLEGRALEERLAVVLARRGHLARGALEGLAHLLGYERTPTARRSGSVMLPEARFRTVTAHLRRLAVRRVPLLRLEDLQWGPDALGLCAHLLSEAPDLPVLAVATVQSEALEGEPTIRRRLEALAERPGCRRLEVGPVDVAALRGLLSDTLGVAPELARRVAEGADGNPLWAIETVREWAEHPTAERPPPERVTTLLPRGLAGVWSAHLGRLLRERPATDETALEIAAVIGDPVETDVWREACRRADVSPRDDLLGALFDTGLARAHGTHGRALFRFAHGSLRTALLGRARRADRSAALHRVVADALTARGAEPETIGRHRLGAGDHAGALEPLLAGAIDRALTGELEAARRALALHADACDRLEHGSREDVARARRTRVRARLLAARIADVRERFDEMARHAETAHAEARALAEPALIAAALVQHARWLRRVGRTREEHALLARAGARAREAADGGVFADVAIERGWAYLDEGDVDAAAAWFEAGLARAPRAELGRRGRLREGLASVERHRGRREAGVAQVRAALEAFERASDRHGAMTASYWLGELHRGRDDEAALRALGRAERIARELGMSTILGMVQLKVALVHGAASRLEQAARAADEGLVEVERVGRPALVGAAYVTALPTDAALDRWEAFDRHVEEGAAALRATGYTDEDLARCAEAGARAAAAAGRTARAARAWRLAAACHRRGDDATAAARADAEADALES
ncbi:MAG TPA: protein kinase [Sandaracinaceae bacterium LLY-WYZ-13_1]|nr:protein kinase [Sandaracinaceae bacterium LLY-WYZ-13_1]